MPATAERRRGPRVRKTRVRKTRAVDYRNLTHRLPRAEAYSADQIAAIHEAALTVLEEIGVRVLHDGARAILAEAGADVTDLQVRYDRALIAHALANAPASFTLTGPGRTVAIGGDALSFLPVGGPPHAVDLDRGRRPGTLADAEDFIRLTQHFDVLHLTGPCAEPQDIDPAFRHLHTTRALMTLSDKPGFVYSRGAAQVADCFAMMRLRMGLTEEAFAARPHTFTVINTNSPLILDVPMCQGLIDFARAGQVSIITPFTLAGAMAPVTIPGALVQQHAEMLSALVLAQAVRPGAPVVYGGFTSNVDMGTGAPAFGTPEYVRAAFATGQLARLIGLPWRSSASCTANAPDAQAAAETSMALWGAVLGGANMVVHAAGWLEGGLAASYEKFVMDAEQLQQMAELMQAPPWDAGELALEAIREIGSGGHHFGTAHTLARYETAFYRPLVSDWSTWGQWQAAGSPTTAERANAVWKRLLREFEPPPLDPAIAEALDAFVARRTAEGGAPPLD